MSVLKACENVLSFEVNEVRGFRMDKTAREFGNQSSGQFMKTFQCSFYEGLVQIISRTTVNI